MIVNQTEIVSLSQIVSAAGTVHGQRRSSNACPITLVLTRIALVSNEIDSLQSLRLLV